MFDSPEALWNVLGFIYGMRAKVRDVKIELDLDLGYLLPECDKVERKMGGHLMGRVMDVEKVLAAMLHPEGSGAYSVHVEDPFLAENTGTYEVRYENGKAVCVRKLDAPGNMTVPVNTFCQLALGVVSLAQAEYQPGTVIHRNRETLERVFVQKALCSE